MHKSLIIATAVLIISGCGSNPPKEHISSLNLDNAVNEDGEKLYCRSEFQTGTHIKKKTCLTKAEKDAIKQASEDYRNARIQSAPGVKNVDG